MKTEKDQVGLADLQVRIKTLEGLASNLVSWTTVLKDSYDKNGCPNLTILDAMLLTLELIKQMALSSTAIIYKEKRDDR